MPRLLPTICGLLLLAFVTEVHGEEYGTIQSQPAAPSSPRHSSTFFEGYMRGAADWERADGEWMLHYSQARVNLEEARRRAGENHRAEVRGYFQLREENRRWRAAERRPSTAPSIHSPTQMPAKNVVPAAKPAPFQLAADGRVEWPCALRTPAFAVYRERLESLLAERTAGKRLSLADRESLQSVRREMLDELKGQVHELLAPDYLAARQCIHNLTNPIIWNRPTGQLAEK